MLLCIFIQESGVGSAGGEEGVAAAATPPQY